MEYLLNINQGLLLLIIFVLALTTVVLIVGGAKKSDLILGKDKQVEHLKNKLKPVEDNLVDIRDMRNELSIKEDIIKALKDSRETLHQTIEHKNKQLDTLKDNVKEYETIIDSAETDILKYLRFIMPDGTIANNVKVKTVFEDEKVVRLNATIRRRIDGKYVEVAVASVIQRPSES